LLWAQRDHAGAAPLLKQVLEIAQRNLDLAAAAQSERQQLVMAHFLRSNLDCYLSLARMANLSPEDAYRQVLAAKGVVFERQRRPLKAKPHSRPARRFTEYQETVRQLARLALATPDPQQAQASRAKIAELSLHADQLEAELARRDPSFRAERAQASRTPEQLQA